MARKAKQKISYVLPLAKETKGHRLGVNGLAVDSDNSILYTGGRDGVICTWDLNLDLNNSTTPDYDAKLPAAQASSFRQQVQAHTNWINDIALAQQSQALISASSDCTVKLWRPLAADGQSPQPLGLHSDFVKVLTVPSIGSDWVASGGLDRKINIWDLSGSGQKLTIDVGEDEAGGLSSKEKGSVYALGATTNMVASGGPESTVRVWDTRNGKRITKLVGHTDNIRDVLISQDGTTIMTASSDRTVKVWSTIAGRCMFTLTMHDASVWSLFSRDPDLSIFYSSDKNGVIAKTDTRNTIELDEGLSVAVAQESEGVHKIVTAGDSIWTATSRPSINRWRDVNTDNMEIEVPENYTGHRASVASTRIRVPSPQTQLDSVTRQRSNSSKRKMPLKHMLRLSNTSYFPTATPADDEKRGSIIDRQDSPQEASEQTGQAIRAQPDYSIEGQNGLIKHVMLNDRKRVLTVDTASEVMMWDLIRCIPIKSFGKRDIDDIADEQKTSTIVSNWCSVDVRTGNVAVTLEENTCFDAEIYADELDLGDNIELKEDQRINLGKWVLRYLFSNLIAEEIRRDQAFRKQLLNAQEEKKLQRDNAPGSIQMPQGQTNGWHADESTTGPQSASTLRPTNKPSTPGLGIGVVSPLGSIASPVKTSAGPNALSSATENGDRHVTTQPRQSFDQRASSDYFSPSRTPNPDELSSSQVQKAPVTPGEPAAEEKEAASEGTPKPDTTPGKEAGLFGKKFSMKGMSFGSMKKIGRVHTNEKTEKPSAVAEEKEDTTESDDRSSKTSNSRVVDDNFAGTIQKIRFAYEDSISQQLQSQQAYENGLPGTSNDLNVPSAITPTLPSDSPVLKLPSSTIILVQEDRPEAGGLADLCEATVGSLSTPQVCDNLEKLAPMWLGELLLRNQWNQKDVVKTSFILEPMQGSGLPGIGGQDGNNRLNANRMLRAKKILGYVAERVEPQEREKEEKEGEAKLKPEEYLELWCQGQIVPPTMTLATIRHHLWRGSSDVVLYYKSNGRKQLNIPKPEPTSPKPTEKAEAEAAA